jgi:hypothetical protein
MNKSALVLLPLLLVGGCRAQESLGNNAAASTPGTAAPVVSASGPVGSAPGDPAPAAAPVQTATLTGLYESGAAPRRSQMCAIERAGRTRFALVVWSGTGESCSGSGTAVRNGTALRLAMEGDEPCTIEARIEGTRVTFPAALPAGCNYYCSRGGRLAGATFDKTGGAEADALRAEDLAGDRLCAS